MLAYAIDFAVILILQIILLAVLLYVVPAVLQPVAALLERTGDEIRNAAEHQAYLGSAAFLLIALYVLAQLVVELGYFVFSEMTTGGRSLGKAIMKLRVVGPTGLRITLRESLARNLMRAVDMLPLYYTVGLIAMIISPSARRLGDVAAGTLVVRLDRPSEAATLLWDEEEDTGRFRFGHDQIAALGSVERRLVRQALRRIETVPPDQAEEILDRSAGALARKLRYEGVEPEDREAFLRALLREMDRR